jgi:hypothetical protein
MEQINAANEDWVLLRSFFPLDWKQIARRTGALKGLRQDKSEENCLRILLMHLGCGYSMRETVVRARQAQLGDISDVALLKRLRKSKEWLHQLCSALFTERGIDPAVGSPHALRLIDATDVKEPGKTGSLWRIHYSLSWPELKCDYFKLTPTKGEGCAESLRQHPLRKGDHVLADRGYSHASGIHFASDQQAFVIVRLNPDGIRIENQNGQPFELLEKLQFIQQTGEVASWPVLIPLEGRTSLKARLCIIRKSQAAIELAQAKLRRRANKHGMELQPSTLIYAQYVMVLTTFPEEEFPAQAVLELYRFRWQIELVFKRFKQIAQLGHLPKQDDDSAKAWLYGKLFVALLTEKLIAHARIFSPWGYSLQSGSKQSLA